MLAATPANAHRSPATCNANEFDANLIRDKFDVKNGDVINYYVTVDNLSGGGGIACDVSNITVLLQLPTASGAPSAAAQTVVANASYAAGQGVLTFGPFPYTVNSPANVTRLEARISVSNGDLHDGPTHSKVNINKTIGSDKPTPSIEVDKVANIKSGAAPQDVTYTFRLYNRTSPPRDLVNVTLTDNRCSPLSRVAPTALDNGDAIFTPAEVWEYTCVMRHGAGVFTNTAQACAELIIDSGPIKVCDTDDESVEFTPPPPPPPAAPPQVAVKPTTVAQAPCTLSTPSGIVVRAKQLNTIRVRVRNVDAGSQVSITLPGSKKAITAKTNASGIATLRVRPTKSGTARIRVAECSEVESLRVRPARRVQAQNNPRVTG